MVPEAGTPIHPIPIIGSAYPVDLYMPTNRRLPVPVQVEFTVGRLKDPPMSRSDAPVPMGDPPFAFVGMPIDRPRAQHAIESVIQTLEDARATDPGVVPCPPNDDRVEQSDQRLLAGMAMTLDDQPQLLDVVLDRLGTGHDPRLVSQQTSPRVFGRPRFAYRIVSNGKAEEGKARGSFRYRQGVGNPR